MRRIVVVSIEGLGTNLVGAYGNSLTSTPTWDSFASSGLVFDQFWGDHVFDSQILKSWWSGHHFVTRQANENIGDRTLQYSSWREAVSCGMLVTDASELGESVGTEFFERVVIAEKEENEEIDCEFRSLIESALGAWIPESDDVPLLWIHSKGLNGLWDAPYDFRMTMCDEEDPKPPSGIEPMRMVINAGTDPDEVFGIACSVGGQSIVFDEVWRELLDTLKELRIEDETLVILTGTSGYPLGEHGVVGCEPRRLYPESIHLPCIMRFGTSSALGCRSRNLVQPNEMSLWMELWLNEMMSITEITEKVECLPVEDVPKAILAVNDSECLVGTPAWICKLSGEAVAGSFRVRTELYAMPDDRWGQNEVSNRATSVVDKLEVLKGKLFAHLQKDPVGEPLALSEWLDEELVQVFR